MVLVSADFSLIYPLAQWQAEQSLDFTGCSVRDVREACSARQLRQRVCQGSHSTVTGVRSAQDLPPNPASSRCSRRHADGESVVEVPVVESQSEFQQHSVEQTVDIPVHGGVKWARGDLQGNLPGRSSTASSRGGLQRFVPGQSSTVSSCGGPQALSQDRVQQFRGADSRVLPQGLVTPVLKVSFGTGFTSV